MTNDNRWRKSSYSGSQGGNCMEIADHAGILIRDTKQAGTGPVIKVTPAVWRAFTANVKRSLDPGK